MSQSKSINSSVNETFKATLTLITAIMLSFLLLRSDAATTGNSARFFDDKGRLIQDSIRDFEITSEKIEFNLYPTLISTDISFDLVNNSDNIKKLDLVLFESSDLFINEMVKDLYPPLDNLQITSAGEIVDAQLCAGYHNTSSSYKKKGKLNELNGDSSRSGVLGVMEFIKNAPAQIVFWKFELSILPQEKKNVKIHFVQILYYHKAGEDSTTICYYYPFPIHRIWGKAINNVEIDFKYHWDSQVGTIQKHSYPHYQNDTALHWEYNKLDANEDISVRMTFPNRWIQRVSSGVAQYDVDALSNTLILKDRIIRFNRAREISAKNWNTFIEELLRNSSNDRDKELSRVSRKFLSDFRLHLIRNWWENPEIDIKEKDAYYVMNYDKARNLSLQMIIANNCQLWANYPLNIYPVLVKRFKKVERCLKWLTPKGDLPSENLTSAGKGITTDDRWVAAREDGLQRFEKYSDYLESPLLAGRVYLLIVSNMRYSKRMKTLFFIGLILSLSGIVSCVYLYRIKIKAGKCDGERV